ncbi:hypothetical protein AVV36_gp066 [Pectobacterium bacteriophage PM2]|uniref:Uncharacterized protein n=1 Tax=Pectobacterium bacteriophage PM2 TaxID=1429794 RepID=A0A0A0Q0J3_9CAUD|nr:hypothetical protein AVV36_gp066 [Pectobacterium bacteriophage PM2]AHY25028.1 hypothetical protein PM2_066 [Pectobacterium bacteriophage PM2]
MLQPGDAFYAEINHDHDIDNSSELSSQYTDEQLDEAIERIEQETSNEARIKAHSILKKNKREIKRLNDLASGAVLENNFDSYSYAIKKLRKIYRQPTNETIITTMWQTTRQQIWNLINDRSKEI